MTQKVSDILAWVQQAQAAYEKEKEELQQSADAARRGEDEARSLALAERDAREEREAAFAYEKQQLEAQLEVEKARAQKARQVAETEVASLKAEVERRAAEKAELETRLAEARTTHEQTLELARQSERALQAATAQHNLELDQLQTAVARARSERAQLVTQVDQLTAKLAETQQALDSAEARHHSAVAELRQALETEHALSQQLLGEVDEIGAQLQARDAMIAEFGDLRQDLRATRARLATAEAAYAEVAPYKDKLTAAERAVAELRHAYETGQAQLAAKQQEFHSLEHRLEQLKETEESAGNLRAMYQQYHFENSRLRQDVSRLEAEVEKIPPLKEAVSKLKEQAEHASSVAYEEHLKVERLLDTERHLQEQLAAAQAAAQTDRERVRSMSALIEAKNIELKQQELAASDRETAVTARLQEKQDEYLALQLRYFKAQSDLEDLERFYKEKYDTLNGAITRLEKGHDSLLATYEKYRVDTEDTVAGLRYLLGQLEAQNRDLQAQLAAKSIASEFQEAFETKLVEFAIRVVRERGGYIYDIDETMLRDDILRERGAIRDLTAQHGPR
jgi:chromosome segregation ATPase